MIDTEKQWCVERSQRNLLEHALKLMIGELSTKPATKWNQSGGASNPLNKNT
jgi:hypothetical protein